MEAEQADVCIIGGGAAGLTAAIFAAQTDPSRRVVVLDGAKTLGSKILVSGGGRCNVTHDEVLPTDFNGSKPIVRNVLAAFDVKATVDWFMSMGVEMKREPTGKLFPISDSAKTVLHALLGRCEALNVALRTSSRVTGITPPTDGHPFTVTHDGGQLLARRVIVSTGGRSLPRSGSDGAGWEMVKSLGHSVTDTYAALVPLVVAPQMFHADASGTAMEVELSVTVGGKRVDHRTGSLLWTHFGVSGPVVMDASRHWTRAQESGEEPVVKVNLLPGEDFEGVEGWIIRSAAKRPRAAIVNHLAFRLPERVVAAILRRLKIHPQTFAGQVSRDDRRAIVHALTALTLPILQHRGWNYAEVTAGGVPLNEIDYRTMESRKTPGLYLAGEILDCDGRIGGYNFQWAWATGYLAGRAAAKNSPENA